MTLKKRSSRALTQQQAAEDAKAVGAIIKGEYINAHTLTLYECSKCSYEWKTAPNHIQQGTGCNICANNRATKSHRAAKLQAFNAGYFLMSEYKNNKTKAIYKCFECRLNFELYPRYMKQGYNCPHCFKIAKKERYEAEALAANLELLSDDITSVHKLALYRCLKCSNIYEALPNNVRKGKGCRLCKPQSRGEKELKERLEFEGVKYEQQVKFNDLQGKGGRFLPYDFRIYPNILIEVQGLQHYKPIDYFGGEDSFKSQQERDAMKRRYARAHGFELLEIDARTKDSLKNGIEKIIQKLEDMKA